VIKYVLPDLPYDYAALEPHLSATVMQLHHDKHHRNYVVGANAAVERLFEARRQRDFAQVAAIEEALAFNLSGHVLHSLFWKNLSPEGGGPPEGALGEDIARDFGSFESFQQQIVAAAGSIMGSGWAALVWDPVARRLGTTQIRDHQSQITQGGVLLMVIDAWEHAYYLQYRTEKAEYFKALWHLWNWPDIARRYALAQQVELGLENVSRQVASPAPPDLVH
jgi:superoxide dismutase, Fe-Mn family